jgi:hypothetical protein
VTQWEIKGREFGSCNCSYGCPCQFNALPTHGHCHGFGVYDIERGFHGSTRLDELKAAAIFRWPGPIHEGKGECVHMIDRGAAPEQRAALLRIMGGEDTAPGATIFQIFAATCDTIHDPIVADIAFAIDIGARTASARIAGVIEARGEPILNPITGAEHRVRIVQPNGFEFAEAEIGRGWSKTMGPIRFELDDTYGQFAEIHLCQSGMVR